MPGRPNSKSLEIGRALLGPYAEVGGRIFRREDFEDIQIPPRGSKTDVQKCVFRPLQEPKNRDSKKSPKSFFRLLQGPKKLQKITEIRPLQGPKKYIQSK